MEKSPTYLGMVDRKLTHLSEKQGEQGEAGGSVRDSDTRKTSLHASGHTPNPMSRDRV